MKRRSFFGAFAALAVTVVTSPSVFAKIRTVEQKKVYYTKGIVAFIKESQDQINMDWSEAITEKEWDDLMLSGPLRYSQYIPSANECRKMGIHVEYDKFGRPCIRHPMFKEALLLRET